jgi:hypothetical protein
LTQSVGDAIVGAIKYDFKNNNEAIKELKPIKSNIALFHTNKKKLIKTMFR